MRAILEPFARLSRCPICKLRPSSLSGCCPSCAEDLFAPHIDTRQLTLGVYRGKLETAVRALKFQRSTRLARCFGQALASELRRAPWQFEVICSVPLHWRRRLARGYNQSTLIAQVVARELALPCRPLLVRTRATQQQARLDRQTRQTNVAGAFRARALHHTRILLIDDVLTSGATLGACRAALYAAGATRVYQAAVARA